MLRIKTATPAEVREAIGYLYAGKVNSPSAYYTQTASGLSLVRACYEGGDAALNLLIRKQGESQSQWLTRQRYFENRPVVENAVNERAEDIYGNPPDRCWYFGGEPESDPSKELDKWAHETYEDNGADNLFRNRVAVGMVRDRYCWVKVWAEDDGSVRFGYLPREQVMAIMDPDDADTVLAYVEVRKRSDRYIAWMWTTDGYGQIGDDFQPLPGAWDDNPVPGVLPFVCFGDYYGRDAMSDAVLMQRTAINARSLTLLGARSQMYSTPVAVGEFKTSEFIDPISGEKGIRIGSPDALIQMQEGGSFSFQNPNIDLRAMLDMEAQIIKGYANDLRLSVQSVDPSAVAEQSMALAIRERRSQSERRRWVNMVKPSEKQLADVVLAYGFAFDQSGSLPPGDYGDVEIDIAFTDSTLPIDRQIERAADQADVAATPPRMTVADYVKKWVLVDADDDEVERYIEQLGLQASSVATNRAEALGMPPRREGGSALASLLGASRIGERISGESSSGQPGGPAIASTITTPGYGGFGTGTPTAGGKPRSEG